MKTSFIISIGLLLATFGFGQTPEDNPRNYVVNLTTTITDNPPSISFKWEPFTDGSEIYIYRKKADSKNWNQIKKLPKNATDFIDSNVETSVNYEYKILKSGNSQQKVTYVNAGIKLPEVENRGKIIVLVDDTFTADLRNELLRLESDLIGDGWEVLRKNISRNASVKFVKEVIRDLYYSDSVNINSLFLLGHIPVPYSGDEAYDAHCDKHQGAWPSDLFYGDMNEKIWTDKTINDTSALRKENWNVPGDGKFDVITLPSSEKISLKIGRVDFYDLPAFPQSETELLRNYLNKNHAFRHKINEPKMQALVDDNWNMIGGGDLTLREGFAISGWRNFSALLNSTNVKAGDFFADTKNESYIWSYGCGGGTFTSCKNLGNTTNFVIENPKTVFTALYGSWFGDWDTQNNFMRAALATNGWILTSCWAGRPYYTFHQMGMGETIGYCVRATQNNYDTYPYSGCKIRGIHISLLGDPSLRMYLVRPVNSLKTEKTDRNTVILSWNQPDGDVIGNYIYRLDTETNKFKRIYPAAISGSTFEDFIPDSGINYYMVRSLQLTNSASGSFYNLSQGVFDTVWVEPQSLAAKTDSSTNPNDDRQLENYSKTDEEQSLLTGTFDAVTTDIKNEFLIYPNPSNGKFAVSFGNSTVRTVSIKIYDIRGKLMRMENYQNTSEENFDISSFPQGIYIVNGSLDGQNFSSKLSLK